MVCFKFLGKWTPEGLPGALYLVSSRKGISNVGSGGFSVGLVNWVEPRVRVGRGGSNGRRTIVV